MSITDVRVQVPPRAPRSTGGLPSGGTPQRGDTGSKVHIDARVVEFRLRRGFIYGKAPVRRKCAAGQKAGGVGLLYLFEILKYRF